jgi:hypothetical protein
MRINNTSTIESTYIKALIFGPSGAGKTSIAKTIANPKDILVISAESGLLSLAGSGIDYIDITVDDSKKDMPPTPLQPSERITKLKEVYDYLAKGTNYKWVMLDSLTELSQIIVTALQKEFPDRKDSLVLWSENAKRMRAIIKNFRDLPKYNVVMTSLIDIDKDENNKRFTVPDVAGSLKREVQAFFDEVFYLHVDENGARQFITMATPTMNCKDRSGKLDKIEPASLDHVFKKIKGEKKDESGRDNKKT